MGNIEKKYILYKFGERIKRRYIEGLSEVTTTKKSINSIAIKITNDSVTLEAGYWFPAIDFGRRRRKGGDSGSKFHDALKDWIVAKDDFKLGWNTRVSNYYSKQGMSKRSFRSSQKVNLENATRSLQYKINKYGTQASIVERNILRAVNTDDLQEQLKEDLGNAWHTEITQGIVNLAKFQFLTVTTTSKPKK